jgi:hypothetical protein
MFQDLTGLIRNQTFEIWERPDLHQTVWISAQTALQWAVFAELPTAPADPELLSISTQENEELEAELLVVEEEPRAALVFDDSARDLSERKHAGFMEIILQAGIIMLFFFVLVLEFKLLFFLFYAPTQHSTELVHREQALSDFFHKPLRFEWNVSLAVLEFADVVRILEQPYATRVPPCRLTCEWRSPGPSFIPIREEEALGLTLRLSAQYTAVFQIPAVYGFKPTASVCRQHICDLIRSVFQAMVNSPCDLLVTSTPSLFSGC